MGGPRMRWFEVGAAIVSALFSVLQYHAQVSNFSPTPVPEGGRFEPIPAYQAGGPGPTADESPAAEAEFTFEDQTKVISATGKDRNGNSADFKIVIISQEYGWKKESVTQVVNLEGRPFDLIGYLKGKGLQNDLSHAQDLIAIGAASCEGVFKRELRRAEERAMQLVAWLRQVRPAGDHPRDLYTLNLGRHSQSCDEESDEGTIHQRLVTIVWIPKKETGVRLQEALHDAMNKLGERGELRLNPADYSVFRLRKAT